MTTQDIQHLIDTYADGELTAEQAQRLLALLESSSEIRQQLAAVTVVERLLRAHGKGPVAIDRVMKAVAAERDEPEQKPDPAKKRILVRKDKAGVRAALSTGSHAARSRTYHPAVPATVLVGLLLAVGALLYFEPFKETVSIVPATVPAPQPVPPPTVPPVVEPTPAVSPAEEGVAATPDPAHVFAYRAFPPDPPAPPAGEDLSAPTGDGSAEPGFVPPPPEWLNPHAPRPAGESVTGSEPRAADPPLLWVKIRHGARREWAATPGDLPALLRATEERLGLSYGMEIRGLDEINPDPAANPILYITGHYHFIFTPEQRGQLRRFMLAGGTILFNAGLGSKPAYDSARRELRLMMPEIPIERLHPDHAIYHAYYDLDRVSTCPGVEAAGFPADEPWLEGITISCRTAAVISRWGLAAGWEGKQGDSFRAYRSEDALRLGINLFTYATSIHAWARPAPLTATYADPGTSESGRMFVAQIMHGGEWRTRYTGLTTLLHTFNQRTEVPVKFRIKAMALTDPEIFNHPLLYVTGHEPLKLTKEEIGALRRYLLNGGFLFAEACCGRAGFDGSFRSLMRTVLPDNPLQVVPPESPLFQTPNRITYLGVTQSLGAKRDSMLIRPRLESIQLGPHYGVIYSPYGLAGGWEMSQTPYADGYEDPDTLKLGQNILMYALTQ